MVPFAKACLDAGHEVKVAAPSSFAAAVAATGLDHAPFADVAPDVLGPIFARLPHVSHEEANRTVMADIFGRLDAQAALPGVTEIVTRWRPDVVVREFCEFASLVAARQAGVPQVEVAIGLASGLARALEVVAAPLAELDAIAGVPEGTAYEALASSPVLSCVPTEVDGDGAGARVMRFRDASFTAEQGPPPPWGDQGHPLVYVTFGSVAAGLPPFAGVYRSALEALADQPIRVLMTTGAGVEPASLAPVPANAHVEQWWPQNSVMPHAAVVVGHGGFGTTMTALAGGVPQVVIPLFASDQFINGERVAAIGAGVCLGGGPGAIPVLAAAVGDVLGNPAYAQSARGVAGAMAELPDVASAVPFLEDLAGR
jgi:UDP:flavonoid glycosyltransferase YjiC (YdhE family)